jgi:ankyrin repeat protein
MVRTKLAPLQVLYLLRKIIGEVKLAHFSIKEYLLSEPLRTGGTSLFHLTSAELSHALISQTCLAYLLQSGALHLVGKGSRRSIMRINQSFPLINYAARHWVFHAQSGAIDQSEQSWTLTLAQELFMPKFSIAKFDNWIKIWDLDEVDELDSYYKGRPSLQVGSHLYYASRVGLQQVVVFLLKSGEDVNAHGGYYGTALKASLAGGHEATMRLLLENEADVNAQGGFHHLNALQEASVGGHETIVRLLLENGADVNAHGGFFGPALHSASARGHDAIARLLLENGANVNAQGKLYGTALQAASTKGNEEIARLLLENGADVNAQGEFSGPALQGASAEGHETIARLLLKNGADVNAQGGFYGTALQAASARGHEAIARLLLENGADVNAQGGQHGTALQAASDGGHQAIVELLLKNGANITSCFRPINELGYYYTGDYESDWEDESVESADSFS